MEQVMIGKRSDAVDRHVGARVRFRRLALRMSQERLAEELGVTFQQIQKYEKGVNRIGAGRLFRLATILGVAPNYFFVDAPSSLPVAGDPSSRSAEEADLFGFVNGREGFELNRAFMAIEDRRLRKAILDLVRATSESFISSHGGCGRKHSEVVRPRMTRLARSSKQPQ
jgi:transcriptional regulator with XRE-family HTH domain